VTAAPNAAVPQAPVCPCCTFGNHTEICTCDGSSCCHPAKHGSQRDRLHRQLVAARAEADGLAEAMRNADRLYGQHLAEVRLVADAAEGAKKRAVELHHPVTLMGMVCCDECSTQRRTGPHATERIAFIPHPCRTIKALNGEA